MRPTETPLIQNVVPEQNIIKPLKIYQNAHLEKINCFTDLHQGFLASGSSDNTIKIWDLDTHRELKVL